MALQMTRYIPWTCLRVLFMNSAAIHMLIFFVSHSFRRSESLVLGEVDWINYLAEGGVSVAKAIPSNLEDL